MIGHFIIATIGKEKLVGQPIKRSQESQNGVIVCLYLLLFDEDTSQPQLLPQCLSDIRCDNLVELIRVNKVTGINAKDINGVAFIFCFPI
jgi:hypothetical protein